MENLILRFIFHLFYIIFYYFITFFIKFYNTDNEAMKNLTDAVYDVFMFKVL